MVKIPGRNCVSDVRCTRWDTGFGRTCARYPELLIWCFRSVVWRFRSRLLLAPAWLQQNLHAQVPTGVLAGEIRRERCAGSACAGTAHRSGLALTDDTVIGNLGWLERRLGRRDRLVGARYGRLAAGRGGGQLDHPIPRGSQVGAAVQRMGSPPASGRLVGCACRYGRWRGRRRWLRGPQLSV